MKIRVLLPSGELKAFRADPFHTPSQFLSFLSSQLDLDFTQCHLKSSDSDLDPTLSLQENNVRNGDLLEIEPENSVDLAYCDIAKRRKSLKDWIDFFTELTQRLVPAQEFMTPEYVRLVLVGQKETIRLLDVRNYKFPQWMYAEDELSPGRLLKYCGNHPILKRFVTKDCIDQSFLIKVIASLDYGYCVQLNKELMLRKSAQRPPAGAPTSPLVPIVLIRPQNVQNRAVSLPERLTIRAVSTPEKPIKSPKTATKRRKTTDSDSEVYHSDDFNEMANDPRPEIRPVRRPITPQKPLRHSDDSDTLVIEPTKAGNSLTTAIELD